MTFRAFLAIAALCVSAAATAPAAAPQFRAGAAKIDITPPLTPRLPMSGYPGREDGHSSIHDPLWVRAIAIDDGNTRAAIVVADLIGFSNDRWAAIADRITSKTGIARDYLFIAGTHTHGAPSLARPNDKHEGSVAYSARVEAAMSDAVEQALASLQPARMAAGNGRAFANMNRRALFHDGRWWLGFNPEGPSDKTVGVVSFTNAAGEPFAVLVNYGVHGTSMSQHNEAITGDNPGATSRYIEKHYSDKVVAVWTSGAAGDQAPLYDRSPRDWNWPANMGRLVGDEALAVMKRPAKPVAAPRIRAAQRVVSCPGRRMVGSRNTLPITFEDSKPMDIRLSVLTIGDVALAGVSGEVFSVIGQQVKKASNKPATMMITHCNGSSGYIADDASYEQVSYEIQVTRAKPGCAEKAVVGTLTEMIRGLK